MAANLRKMHLDKPAGAGLDPVHTEPRRSSLKGLDAMSSDHHSKDKKDNKKKDKKKDKKKSKEPKEFKDTIRGKLHEKEKKHKDHDKQLKKAEKLLEKFDKLNFRDAEMTKNSSVANQSYQKQSTSIYEWGTDIDNMLRRFENKKKD